MYNYICAFIYAAFAEEEVRKKREAEEEERRCKSEAEARRVKAAKEEEARLRG